MKSNHPTVRAEVRFLSESDGGRRTLPALTPEYRPHIVVQSADVRTVIVDEDGLCRERYLGIYFVAATGALRANEAVEVTLGLAYHLSVDYSELQAGTTFTIREGGNIVGYGTVSTRPECEFGGADQLA
ncbi:MAG: EF-Tu C-terminal domain-related protein [Planctomycetales bacterium]